MLTCNHCGAKQLVGTIFCSECGAMFGLDQHATQLYASTKQPYSIDSTPPDSAAPLRDSTMPLVMLVIISSGRQVQLVVEDEVLIGRKDEARGIFPEIDLSIEGGYDAGVSRRHAIISRRGDAYYVEDLGSANGTFVNGRQLTPQVPTVLADGDELKCAMLVMRVTLT